jgi:hypothetical protein
MHCISLYHGHDQVRGHQNVFKVQSDESWKHGRLWWLLWLFLWRSYVSWCINKRFPSISLFGLLCCLSHLPEGEKPESGTGTPPQPIGQRISFSIQALPQMHAAASSCSCLRSEWVLEYNIYIYIIIYILKFLLVRALLGKKEIHPTWDEKNETRIFCTGRSGFGVGSSISSRASSEPWNQAGGSEMENSDRQVTGQININQHNTRDKPK